MIRLVARGFSGMVDHLSALIQQAIAHKGFSLVDILQPCVSFNRVNTFAWYQKRCTPLPDDYDPSNFEQALQTALQWGDCIPIGVLYRNDRPSFEERSPVLKEGSLFGRKVDRATLRQIIEAYA